MRHLLQGPIAPAVPFPKAVTDAFTPVGNPGIDWTATELLASVGDGISLTVPPDLTLRRVYLYLFISSDLTKQLKITSGINFYFQNALLGRLPFNYRNYTPFPATAGDFSSVSFSLANSAGAQQLNCIQLELVGPYQNGVPANYGPAETSPVLIAPYEFNLRCDRITVDRFSATVPDFNGRLFLGVLSLKS